MTGTFGEPALLGESVAPRLRAAVQIIEGMTQAQAENPRFHRQARDLLAG